VQSDPALVQADWKHLRQYNALLLPQVKLSATCLWRIDCTRELCGLDFCGKIAFCSRNSNLVSCNLVSSSTKQQGPGKKKDSNGSKSVPRPFASVIRMTSAAPDNRIHSESIAFQGIERKRGDNLRCTFECYSLPNVDIQSMTAGARQDVWDLTNVRVSMIGSAWAGPCDTAHKTQGNNNAVLLSTKALLNLIFSKHWTLRFRNIRLRLDNSSRHNMCQYSSQGEQPQPLTMIPIQTIINYLLTILMLLCGQTIKACWKALNEEQKDSTTESTQRIFKLWKKKLKLKIKIRILKWLRRKSYQREIWAYLRKDQESSQRNKRRSLEVTESKYLHLFICWDHSYILINLSMTLYCSSCQGFFFDSTICYMRHEGRPW